MANTQKNEKVTNTIKAKDLTKGTAYKVCYSCFKSVNGARGKFLSASFIIENADGVKAWVSCPNENSSIKAIGIMTGARDENGNKFAIKSLTPIDNNGYTEFVYQIAPLINGSDAVPF